MANALEIFIKVKGNKRKAKRTSCSWKSKVVASSKKLAKKSKSKKEEKVILLIFFEIVSCHYNNCQNKYKVDHVAEPISDLHHLARYREI